MAVLGLRVETNCLPPVVAEKCAEAAGGGDLVSATSNTQPRTGDADLRF